MICVKCQSNFNCNKQDIENCHCYAFNFNQKTKKIISENYKNCLCNKCLKLFNQFELNEINEDSDKKISLIENKHYYIENNLWVFTEYYHYLRGKCCENNCKNCIYKKNSPI